jgi:predicted MFS family arabinose efflux permease
VAGCGWRFARNSFATVAVDLLLSRLVPSTRRLELLTLLAVLCCLPLLALATHLGPRVAVGIRALSGLGACYNLRANAAFVQAMPAEQRGQAFGLVGSGLAAAQIRSGSVPAGRRVDQTDQEGIALIRSV